MSEKTSPVLDIELNHHDVRALNNPDAIAALFARLGYNTNARTPQTPGNLGITADGTARPIKKIELIADQESLFQVYLFELTSVTVAHTRALARSFRNRTGNYLLVLTSDYDRLDFVFLERYVPPSKVDDASLGLKQGGVRPRVLTVERLKPDRIHLRVLRRLTWTESDPFAQYDKLLSAYALADWSEEYFDNRYILANLIACQKDTPRVVDPEMFRSVFDLQKKIVDDILRSVEEQRALEAAPRSVDPVQQTVATVIQSYLNHPDIDRRRAIDAIRSLNHPMLGVQVRRLRTAYKEYQRNSAVRALLDCVGELMRTVGEERPLTDDPERKSTRPLKEDDLRLICFDFLTGA